jgi:hypothetical protein
MKVERDKVVTIQRNTAVTTQSIVQEKGGDIVFWARTVDKLKKPNALGLIFDWDSPKDVDVSRLETNGVVLYMHEPWSLPVGRIEEIRINNKTVRMKVRIPGGGGYEDLQFLRQWIVDKYLRAVSIGFYIDAYEEKKIGDDTVTVVKKFTIVELSLVTIGAHPTALIEQSAKLREGMDAVNPIEAPKPPTRLTGHIESGEEEDTVDPDELVEVEQDASVEEEDDGTADELDEATQKGAAEAGVTVDEMAQAVETLTTPAPTPDELIEATEAAAKKGESVFEAPECDTPPGVSFDEFSQSDVRKATEPFTLLEHAALIEVEAGNVDGVEHRAAFCVHHEADGTLNVHGVRQAAAILLGAREGLRTVDEDNRRAGYEHVKGHLEQVGMEYVEFRSDYTADELLAFHRAGLIEIPGRGEVGSQLAERVAAIEALLRQAAILTTQEAVPAGGPVPQKARELTPQEEFSAALIATLIIGQAKGDKKAILDSIGKG